MIVHGLFAPNAPNLIAPEVFGGAGAETVRQLRALRVEERIRPDAILVASPHWVSRDGFLVQSSEHPGTLHDFSGLPRALYEVRYDAPGEPALAQLLVEEGQHRALRVQTTEDWGIDHGAWATLLHVAPSRQIPVVPLSIASLPPEAHMEWGEAIGAAAEQAGKRISFVGTGSITHRLDMFDPRRTEPWPEGERIEKEIIDLILARKYADLAKFDPERWATVGPEGDLAPLFMMAGAMGQGFKPRLVSYEQVFGSVGLTVLEWLPE